MTNNELRGELQRVEAEIKGIIGENPSRFYSVNLDGSTYEKIAELLDERTCCLNSMFRRTSVDIARIEEVNESIRGMCDSLLRRVGNLYRAVVSSRDAYFDNDYEFEGELRTATEYIPIEGDMQTDVLRLQDDEYYGSDFYYMAYVIQENEKKISGSGSFLFSAHAVWDRATPDPALTDEQLMLTNKFDDGHSWIHLYRRPELDHVCVCYALHCLIEHQRWSWPDIVRLDSYWVEAKAICQKFSK